MNFSFQIGKKKFSFGHVEPAARFPRRQMRGFDAAVIDRLTADWLGTDNSADSETSASIRTMRQRAREQERNNEWAQRYLCLLDNNVLGSEGVGVQFKAKDLNGQLDKLANQIVRDGWTDWKRRENCTMSGVQCFRDVEGMVLRRTAVDGGVLIRKFQLPDRFAIQVLEIDHLDFDYNNVEKNGNQVRFGIEFDVWRRPVAFYLLTSHPGDIFQQTPSVRRIRIPASEVIHAFWMERPGQTIGVPWFACVMRALHDLGKFREAELVASRVSACKGFAITQTVPQEWGGPEDASGNNIQEMSPGMGMMLDPGQALQEINPTHPNTAFGEFVKTALRGIAAGLGVNYNSLANDLESVNYSSMRAGKLEEVEEYKNIQAWLIETLHVPIFEAWLEWSLLIGSLKNVAGNALPLSKFDKFNAADWKPRRWPWVDPLKDLQASVMAVEKGFRSRRSIIAEMGEDIEEVFQEQEDDNQLAEAHGLEFPVDSGGGNPAEGMADEDETEPPKLTKPKE